MAIENSVITVYRREMLAHATAGQGTLYPITHVALGSGGTDGSGNPIQPDGAATALNNEIGRYPITSVTFPVSTTAEYTVTVPPEDLPGAIFNEAALVDSLGNLNAIRTFFNKGKDPGVAFTFIFDDEF